MAGQQCDPLIVSLVIMSKKVEVNSAYFMPIHKASNNISEGDGALISPLPTLARVVLRSATAAVCNLHLPYRIYWQICL